MKVMFLIIFYWLFQWIQRILANIARKKSVIKQMLGCAGKSPTQAATVHIEAVIKPVIVCWREKTVSLTAAAGAERVEAAAGGRRTRSLRIAQDAEGEMR